MKGFSIRGLSAAAVLATGLHGAVRAAAWDLVWSDEFDKPGALDTAKWNIQVGASTVNGEAEYYTNNLKNIHIADGNLYVTAVKENFGGRNYTSGRINTENKEYWTYGRFEIKAKLPGGKGSWPAFWMLGHDCAGHGGWPNCGEVDVGEYAGKNPNVVNCTMHMQNINYILKNNPHGQATLSDVANNFHVYAVEWFTDRFDFYMDSAKVMTFKNDGKGAGDWPYFNPQYIIINEALGGGYGGTIDNSIFPTQWVIDYVRVYKQGTVGLIATGRSPADAARRAYESVLPDAQSAYSITGRLFRASRTNGLRIENGRPVPGSVWLSPEPGGTQGIQR